MNITLSCPSKTFLIGEYSALVGGPAIILNSSPRFHLHVTAQEQKNNSICRGIKKYSPANKLVLKNFNLLRQFDYEFRDPHSGHGGFGASSAQFLLFYIYKIWLQNPHRFDTKNIDPDRLIKDYTAYAWDGTGIQPSGADLLAQLYGNIVFFHRSEQLMQRFRWPFQELDFFLLRTGHKIATHQHLKTLQQFPSDELQQLVLAAYHAFENANADQFVYSINAYAEKLLELGFVANETLALLERIRTQTPTIAAKGCGALGADVILLVFAREKYDELMNWARENSLKVVATSANTSTGVNIQRKNVNKKIYA